MRVLLNPTVEAAVFETSLEAICDEGLGFDRCQVAVVVGVGNGIRLDVAEWDTPDKQTLVHRTVSDVVLPGGFLVMQAGEPLGAPIAEKCHGRSGVIWAVRDRAWIARTSQRAGAGRLRSREIVFRQGEVANAITAHGPLSLSRLAAIAAAWAVGLDCEQIASASL